MAVMTVMVIGGEENDGDDGPPVGGERASLVRADRRRVAHRLARVQVPHQVVVAHHFLQKRFCKTLSGQNLSYNAVRSMKYTNHQFQSLQIRKCMLLAIQMAFQLIIKVKNGSPKHKVADEDHGDGDNYDNADDYDKDDDYDITLTE